MEIKIGYPDFIFDDEKLEEIYQEVKNFLLVSKKLQLKILFYFF